MWSLYYTEKNVTDPQEVEWGFFVQYVESHLNDVESITIQKSQPGIRFIKDGAEFDIEYVSNVIRKQKNRLGHEPLLLNVQNFNLSMEGQNITLFVTFINGQQKEHTMNVTYTK